MHTNINIFTAQCVLYMYRFYTSVYIKTCLCIHTFLLLRAECTQAACVVLLHNVFASKPLDPRTGTYCDDDAMYVYIYIYTYRYIHTYVHKYIHAYMRTCIHTYMSGVEKCTKFARATYCDCGVGWSVLGAIGWVVSGLF